MPAKRLPELELALRQAQITMERKQVDFNLAAEQRNALLMEIWRSGYTQREIGVIMGLAQSSVSRLMRIILTKLEVIPVRFDAAKGRTVAMKTSAGGKHLLPNPGRRQKFLLKNSARFDGAIELLRQSQPKETTTEVEGEKEDALYGREDNRADRTL